MSPPDTLNSFPSQEGGVAPSGRGEPRREECATFVVVSEWLPSRFTGTKYSFETFDTLAKAVAYHRRIVSGVVRDEAPRGIFEAMGGLPVGGAIPEEVIASVQADPAGNRMPPRSSPNTPENRFLKEAAILNGKSKVLA